VDSSESWEIERLLKTHGIDFRLSAGNKCPSFDLIQQIVMMKHCHLENSALTHLRGKLAGKADAGFTLTRTTLNSILTRQTTFPNAIRAGDIKVEGEVGKLGELIGMLDEIAPDFPIVEPVQAKP
jgi:alkyl sulfatase BDS1-like metallo-beta-lactamase superfamily hydrolase